MVATAPALLKEMYREMLFYRRFEERVNQAYQKGKFAGFCHLHIGQEAVCVGVQRNLRPTDYVISGYRSPASNAVLREQSQGVAKHSLHMDGLAIDLRVPGRNLADVRNAAIALRGGGVGYYPASDFVHVDVGRVRTW